MTRDDDVRLMEAVVERARGYCDGRVSLRSLILAVNCYEMGTTVRHIHGDSRPCALDPCGLTMMGVCDDPFHKICGAYTPIVDVGDQETLTAYRGGSGK